MRVLPDRSRLSGDTHQKRGTNDRPSKNRWHPRLAHDIEKHQGSAQHLRTPWLPPSLDPELLEDCQTPYRFTRERPRVRVGSSLRKRGSKIDRSCDLGTRHCTPRPRLTVHFIRRCISVRNRSSFIPTGLGANRPSWQPPPQASGIPFPDIQQSGAELPHLRQGAPSHHQRPQKLETFNEEHHTPRHGYHRPR